MEEKKLLVVGVNHMNAPLLYREKAAIAKDELLSVLLYLKSCAELEEIVILSTCSRVEVIGVSSNPEESSSAICRWFDGRIGVNTLGVVYAHKGEEAIHHLFRVTCGLDSWILGESEIQGQVKGAYQFALEQGATRQVLNRVFQKALGTGKSIRAKTGIQNGLRSIGGAAAFLAGRIFGSLERAQVLVVGAGQVAESVLRHLSAKNFNQFLISNRSPENAKGLAQAVGGSVLSLEEGIQRLASVEAAIFSLSCPNPIVNTKILGPLLQLLSRPIFLMDLGLPRNIESACAKMGGVFLYNLDDLKEVVRENMERKAAQKNEAEILVKQALRECVLEFKNADYRRSAERVLEKIG